jgi:hypothetical protein
MPYLPSHDFGRLSVTMQAMTAPTPKPANSEYAEAWDLAITAAAKADAEANKAVATHPESASKPANMFWLGNDLMTVFAWLLLGAEKGFINWQLGKAIDHPKQVQQQDTEGGKKLIKIAAQISQTAGQF